MRCVDAHLALKIEVRGAKRIGFDVADAGEDLNAQVYAHMPVVSWCEEWKGREDEILKSSTRVWSKAREMGAHVIYDNIGVGVFVGSHFNELNAKVEDPALRVTHRGFNASGKVWRPESKYAYTQRSNDEMFANLKAQAWWMTADRARNTYNAVGLGQKFSVDQIICIDSGIANLPKLITQLSTPRRDFDQNGKVKVESKADLAKASREGGPVPSPNLADAFVEVCAPGMDTMRISAAALQNA
jgi:phage terminase large subunit